MITVVRDKFARSWPQLDPEKPLRPSDRAYGLPLGEALDRDYRTDAHFTPYRLVNGHRLNYQAFTHGLEVQLLALVLDVDGAGHATTPEWRKREREKVIALSDAHPGLYSYDTRNGYRVVYQQEPAVLRTPDDAQEWSRVYSVVVAYMERRFGIVADPSCKDWQRLYRLPRSTRDTGGQPENHPTWGDPHDIGDLVLEPTDADIETAAKRAHKAFLRRKSADYGPHLGGGDGLLYHLLHARGEVFRKSPRGGWICLCPNRAEHTIDTNGSDTTVVFPPPSGAEIGVIDCKHGHCEGYTNKGWLKFFSDAELDAAREAAGIRTRKRCA